MTSEEWDQTLVSLTRKFITWYNRRLNVEYIILNCGSFPNVPLIRSKGCISYNLTLAFIQLRYVMLGKPEDEAFEEMVLH